tara:strand:- start:1738 stop:2268 length:531 start_codon:yes stop_codon:yes gene_type:complete
MQSTKASLRYAKAVFEIAQSKGVEDKVFEDLNNIRHEINRKTELFYLIKDPTIKCQNKITLFKKVFETKTDPLTMQFLILVLTKNREFQLVHMIDKYEELYNKKKGISVLEVVSSEPLGDTMKEAIKLKIKPGKQVKFKETIDKSLLGGFIVNSEGLQYDASIRKKINNIKRAFKL